MQEDQPTFKVTDRRLFNADGSPRDVPPDEKPEEPKVAAATEPAAAAAVAPEPEPEPEVVEEQDRGLSGMLRHWMRRLGGSEN